jgi:hypothetical protein
MEKKSWTIKIVFFSSVTQLMDVDRLKQQQQKLEMKTFICCLIELNFIAF